MNKKGQVTIFIIIGIILVSTVLFFIWQQTKKDEQPTFIEPQRELSRNDWAQELQHLSIEEAEEIIEFVFLQEQLFQEEIIQTNSQNTINTLLNQGGIIAGSNHAMTTELGPIAFVSNTNNELEPSITTIEQELTQKICQDIQREITNDYATLGELIQIQNIECSIIITESRIRIDTYTTMLLEPFREQIIVANSVPYEINMKQIINERNNIIQNFNPSSPGDITNYPDMTITFLDAETIMVKTKHEQTDGTKIDFRFAFKYEGERT